METNTVNLPKTQINRTRSASEAYKSKTTADNSRLKIENTRNAPRRRSMRERTSPSRRVSICRYPNRRAHSWDAAIDGGLDTEARLAQLLTTTERTGAGRKRKRPLEEICLHCKFVKELENQQLKDAIEAALKDLALTAQEEDSKKESHRHHKKKPLPAPIEILRNNAPDIIVSSVSSEDGSATDPLSDTQDTQDTQNSQPSSPCPSMNWSSSSSSLKEDVQSPTVRDSKTYTSLPEGSSNGTPGIPSISITECLDQLGLVSNSSSSQYSKNDRSMSIQTDVSDRTLVFDIGDIGSLDSTPGGTATGPLSPFRTPVDSASSCHTGCSGCFKPMCWAQIPKFIRSRRESSESDISSSEVEPKHQFLNCAISLELPSSLRSSSIDIPSLRRDIEMLSSGEDEEDSSTTLSCETFRAARDRRSRSVPETTGQYSTITEQPTRLERLSILFRKAVIKSPILRQHVQLSLLANNKAFLAENKHRQSRYWNSPVGPTDHIWVPGSATSSGSGSECYIGERDCKRTGEKRRCVACHVTAHTDCLPLLTKMNLNCKPTYYQEPLNKLQQKEREATPHRHHWVHRWRQEGRCQKCNKSFQQRFFKEKDLKAIACSWCKVAYHNKNGCFTMAQIEEECTMGSLREVVVPPSWITKLPAGKASIIRRRYTGAGSFRKKCSKSKKGRNFVVRPIGQKQSSPRCPLVIFVNPKSGGNKGAKLINTFAWLVNPRQVFDIIALKGPKFGLEMYRKTISKLRIMVCGGDGTIGWLLATLDSLKWPTYPPVAILPLGTGNDLARTLGWGGSFVDESLTDILTSVGERSTVTLMDRWKVELEQNEDAEWEESAAESAEEVVRQLPISVMNNYFSIGADAHVALQFHQSRSANPEVFTSRFKNRLFYGGIGTVDLFKRSWKDLSEFITLECDGVDITPMIKGARFHCLLFLNIPRYAGGAMPWGNPAVQYEPIFGSGNSEMSAAAFLYYQREFGKPALNDGKIEVLGLTSATLAAIQVGGHGDRIAQCSRVKIVTRKPIPVQVDGEPCRLSPSIITISLHSKVPMLQRLVPPSPAQRKNTTQSLDSVGEKSPGDKADRSPSPYFSPSSPLSSTSVYLKIPVAVLSRKDYDEYRDEVEQLKLSALEIGAVSVEAEVELEKVREMIQDLLERKADLPYPPSTEWHFVDYVSTEGAFRVSRGQEYLRSPSDICSTDDCLLIMDELCPPFDEEISNKNMSSGSPSSLRKRSSRNRNRMKVASALRMVLSTDCEETSV